MMNFNEQTNTFLYKKYTSNTSFSKRWMLVVCETVSWRRGKTATYWSKVSLTIAALLSHLGWAVQPWVTEGPKASLCRWLSLRQLVSNWLQLQLPQATCVPVIFLFDVHLLSLLFTQVHLLIDGSVEGQSISTWSESKTNRVSNVFDRLRWSNDAHQNQSSLSRETRRQAILRTNLKDGGGGG